MIHIRQQYHLYQQRNFLIILNLKAEEVTTSHSHHIIYT